MFSSKVVGAAVAIACLTAIGAVPAAHAQQPTEVITNGPQVQRGDMGGWSARQNVIASRRYARLVATDPAFRAYRERVECGPITIRSLREECIQSFPHPNVGGSMAPRPYGSYYGR
jgi:hypothetical protein